MSILVTIDIVLCLPSCTPQQNYRFWKSVAPGINRVTASPE